MHDPEPRSVDVKALVAQIIEWVGEPRSQQQRFVCNISQDHIVLLNDVVSALRSLESPDVDYEALRVRLVQEAQITGQHKSLEVEHVRDVVRIVAAALVAASEHVPACEWFCVRSDPHRAPGECRDDVGAP